MTRAKVKLGTREYDIKMWKRGLHGTKEIMTLHIRATSRTAAIERARQMYKHRGWMVKGKG